MKIMNKTSTGLIIVLSISLTILVSQQLYCEVKTIQYTDGKGRTREELVTTEKKGQEIFEIRKSGETQKISRFNNKGSLMEISADRNGEIFKAVKTGTKIEYTLESGGNQKKGSYSIGKAEWFDSWEQAGKFMLMNKITKLDAIMLNEKKPDKALELVITRENEILRKGITVVPFKISPKGLIGNFIPDFYFWFDTSGHLTAQETLMIPGNSEENNKPPKGFNKADMIVTEEVQLLN